MAHGLEVNQLDLEGINMQIEQQDRIRKRVEHWLSVAGLILILASVLVIAIVLGMNPPRGRTSILIVLRVFLAAVGGLLVIWLVAGLPRTLQIRSLLRSESKIDHRLLPRLKTGERIGPYAVLIAESDELHVADSRRIALRTINTFVAVLMAVAAVVALVPGVMQHISALTFRSVLSTLLFVVAAAAFAIRPVALQWLIDADRHLLQIESLRFGFHRSILEIPHRDIRWFSHEGRNLLLGRRWFNRVDDEPLLGRDAQPCIRMAVIGRGALGRWRSRRIINTILGAVSHNTDAVYDRKKKVWQIVPVASAL